MPKLTDKQINDFWSNIATNNEKLAIQQALKTDKPWDVNNLNIKSIKEKIKKFHLELTGERCCYCGFSLRDRNIEQDREHIIPKESKKELSFDLFNLSIACKRCNMTYKNTSIDHIVNIGDAVTSLKNPGNYRIPHPNIDNYEEHIHRVYIDLGSDRNILFYKTITDKGDFLFKFVRLDLLEIGQLDEAQKNLLVNTSLSNLLNSSHQNGRL